jgi:hypothetical protein
MRSSTLDAKVLQGMPRPVANIVALTTVTLHTKDATCAFMQGSVAPNLPNMWLMCKPVQQNNTQTHLGIFAAGLAHGSWLLLPSALMAAGSMLHFSFRLPCPV